MKTQKILLLLIAAATLFSCSENEPPADRTSALKLGYAVEQINPKAAQGSDTTAPQSTPKQMVVTIHDESGNPVLNGERFDLVKIGEEYYSKSILLPTGHYTLEEFMVIDSADQAIYIAPKSGSVMAAFLDHPLPQSFQVEADQDTELMVQVVPAWLGSASDFGYVSFPFEVVRPSAMSVSPGLCATYEEDKLRLNACYDSIDCLLGKWWFKAYIATNECIIEYVPDSVELGTRGMVKLDTNQIPWIKFGNDWRMHGETTINEIGGMYEIDNDKLIIHNIVHTLISESQWGIEYLQLLAAGEGSFYHFVSFNDTLYLYNSKSKFLYVKEKPELWKD